MINHAIRQVYQGQLTGTRQATFMLFLDMNSHQVNINTHHVKHEVRFHQAWLMHDFIDQAVVTVLQQSMALHLPEDVAVAGLAAVLSAVITNDEERYVAGATDSG